MGRSAASELRHPLDFHFYSSQKQPIFQIELISHTGEGVSVQGLLTSLRLKFLFRVSFMVSFFELIEQ